MQEHNDNTFDDDALVRAFFHAHRQPVADAGFSERVLRALPATRAHRQRVRRRMERLWTAACAVAALALALPTVAAWAERGAVWLLCHGPAVAEQLANAPDTAHSMARRAPAVAANEMLRLLGAAFEAVAHAPATLAAALADVRPDTLAALMLAVVVAAGMGWRKVAVAE